MSSSVTAESVLRGQSSGAHAGVPWEPWRQEDRGQSTPSPDSSRGSATIEFFQDNDDRIKVPLKSVSITNVLGLDSILPSLSKPLVGPYSSTTVTSSLTSLKPALLTSTPPKLPAYPRISEFDPSLRGNPVKGPWFAVPTKPPPDFPLLEPVRPTSVVQPQPVTSIPILPHHPGLPQIMIGPVLSARTVLCGENARDTGSLQFSHQTGETSGTPKKSRKRKRQGENDGNNCSPATGVKTSRPKKQPLKVTVPKVEHTDHPSYEKPEESYIELISKAILSGHECKMLLMDIYEHIMEHYPFFRYTSIAWKSSVRHNLSVNECFVRIGNGKTNGSFWTIHPSCLEAFQAGNFNRRLARSKVQHADQGVSKMAATSQAETLSETVTVTEPSRVPKAAKAACPDGYIPMTSVDVKQFLPLHCSRKKGASLRDYEIECARLLGYSISDCHF